MKRTPDFTLQYNISFTFATRAKFKYLVKYMRSQCKCGTREFSCSQPCLILNDKWPEKASTSAFSAYLNWCPSVSFSFFYCWCTSAIALIVFVLCGACFWIIFNYTHMTRTGDQFSNCIFTSCQLFPNSLLLQRLFFIIRNAARLI